MGKFTFHAFVFAMALLAWPAAHADPANAIMRLLNSRASGSRTEYAEAAVEVAEKAKSGSPVYGFVLALVSREQDARPAAKMDDETRKKYLDGCRAKIKRLALEKNNSMAWYLLSLDSGDTNLRHRAADAGNIQARNAWGAFLLARSMDDGVSTNEQKRVMGIAYDHFKAAAAEGDANGLYNLGTCHAHGYGTPQDDHSARQQRRDIPRRSTTSAGSSARGAWWRRTSRWRPGGSQSPPRRRIPTGSSTTASRSSAARACLKT